MNPKEPRCTDVPAVPHQSEHNFHLLVDGIVDYGIFMLSLEGIILTWNSGAERMNRYTATEIVGQHFAKFYPEQDIEAGKPERNLKIARRGTV